jgi:hypothetical protein
LAPGSISSPAQRTHQRLAAFGDERATQIAQPQMSQRLFRAAVAGRGCIESGMQTRTDTSGIFEDSLPMAKTTVTATIKAGQSLSASVNIGNNAPALIAVPSNFAKANLSFQISADGTQFFDLLESDGSETLRAIEPGAAIPLVTLSSAITYLKIRSGPRDGPIVQPSDVTVVLIAV